MSPVPAPTDPRRSFLSRLASGALALTALPIAARRAHAEPAPPAEPWLAPFVKATHKQVFDGPNINAGFPMAFAGTYLNTMREGRDLKPGDAQAMLVLRHGAAVLAVNDTIWAKYKLGASSNVTDPQTKAPALRNPYANAKPGDMNNVDYALDKLPALGVTLVACNLAVTKLAERAGAAIGMKPEDAVAEWKANLLPGVFLAPSGVMAVGRAQETGCSYCYAG